MKQLAGPAIIGVLIGYAAGRFMSLMPPPWGLVFTFIGSAALSFWAFRTLRELREYKRILEHLMNHPPSRGWKDKA